jgi:hypothetical protein
MARNIFVFVLALVGLVGAPTWAGRASRAELRACIASSTNAFPAFQRLVEAVRAHQTFRSYEVLYMAALTELRADLGAGIQAVFKVQRLSSDAQMNNDGIEDLVGRLVADLLIHPQEKAVDKSLDELPDEDKKHVRSQWAGPYAGTIISSHPGWLRDVAIEMDKMPDMKSFVDIGSGHGIPSLLLAQEFPGIEFTGFDFVKAKVENAAQMAREMKLDNVKFKQQDLMADGFKLPVADVYYFFNPANREVIAHVAKQIAEYSKDRPIKVFSMGGWVERVFKEAGCTSVHKPRSPLEIIVCN